MAKCHGDSGPCPDARALATLVFDLSELLCDATTTPLPDTASLGISVNEIMLRIAFK
jgi:hypothetical protein